MVWKDEVYFGVGLEIGFVVSFVLDAIFPCAPVQCCCYMLLSFGVVDESPSVVIAMFHLVGCFYLMSPPLHRF